MVSITQTGATAKELHKKGGERMKTCLFGGLDGIITTFAVVAGAGGGGLPVGVVLTMGFSTLVADALSMGVGDALSSKAEAEVAAKEMQREAWELENYAEGEVKEMVEIYEARGFSPEDAETIVTTMAKYPRQFVEIMLHDELGMSPPDPDNKYDHLVSGAYCFCSFIVCGLVPLLGYVCVLPFTDDEGVLFGVSCGLTALTLFLLGALKSRYTAHGWLRSGLEVLLVGGSCAVAAYGMGALVEVLLTRLKLADATALAGNATAGEQVLA